VSEDRPVVTTEDTLRRIIIEEVVNELYDRKGYGESFCEHQGEIIAGSVLMRLRKPK
jgi:hypothetical protein